VFNNLSVVYYYVTNWEMARAFYAEVLGWPVVYADDDVGWVEYGRERETHLAINRWDGPEPPPEKKGGATATFEVANPEAVTKALRAKGVRCDDVVRIPGVVTYGTFYDPEGNRFQSAESEPSAKPRARAV
jgi:catechol 2,3-dioxygenase-like lactoylglutathione lyase family enzyme